MINLYHGDCLEILKTLPDNSVDSIVTDPPYGLSNHETEDVVECLTNWLAGKEYRPNKKGFMGKSWDGWVPGPEVWKECHRVLKPGGHLLAFAGTRTMDLMYMSIRLAGFELRDSIGHANNASLVAWMHGQGFPKSTDISKQLDKESGAKREVIGSKIGQPGYSLSESKKRTNSYNNGAAYGDSLGECSITAPATEAAKQWEGFGTAIKPAWEPIVLARKPISEKTVAKNVLRWGCGSLNIDGTRIGLPPAPRNAPKPKMNGGNFHAGQNKDNVEMSHFNPTQGRFPSNVVFSHSIFCTDDRCHESCAVRMLDEQSGNLRTGGKKLSQGKGGIFAGGGVSSQDIFANDFGTASRFFYCAKVSPSERKIGSDVFYKLKNDVPDHVLEEIKKYA